MTNVLTAPATTGTTTGTATVEVIEIDDREPLWKRIISALFTLLIVAATVYLWPAPLGGQTRIINVSGHSMEPTYDLGDLVLVRDASPSEIGDIVVFQVPEGETGAGLLVIHRILEIDDEGFFITQGDNRTTPDEWQLTEQEIVGHPLAHLPRGGAFFGFVQQLWVIVAIVGIVVVLLLWPDADNRDDDDDDDGHDDDDDRNDDDDGDPEAPDPADALVIVPARIPTRVLIPGDGDLATDDTTELARDHDWAGAFDFDDESDHDIATTASADVDDVLDRDLDLDLDLDRDLGLATGRDPIDEQTMADAMAWLDEQLENFSHPADSATN